MSIAFSSSASEFPYLAPPPLCIYIPLNPPSASLNLLTLSLAASLLHSGNIIHSSSAVNLVSPAPSSSLLSLSLLDSGVALVDLANQLRRHSACGDVGADGDIPDGNVLAFSFRNRGNQDGESLSEEDVLERVGEEGMVEARLNITMSAMEGQVYWGSEAGIMLGDSVRI
jgi:hypothetical protein